MNEFGTASPKLPWELGRISEFNNFHSIGIRCETLKNAKMICELRAKQEEKNDV